MSVENIYIYTKYIIILGLLMRGTVLTAAICFGPGCDFPCHCQSAAVCDRDTGHCDDGCDKGHPTGFPWRGPGCQIGNIAYEKEASQSTNYNQKYANKSVDGDIGPNMGDGHCSHTGTAQPNPWWEVYLGDLHYIYNITIFNRADLVSSARTTMFYVFVGNHSNPTHLCTNYTNTVPVAGNATLTCTGGPVIAQYVRIQRYDGYILNFCELVIEGYKYINCEPGKFGVTCGVNCGRCSARSCYKIDGVCPQGCQLWALGDKCDQIIDYPRFNTNDPNGKANISAVFRNESSVGITFMGISYLNHRLSSYYYYVVQYATKPYNGWETSSVVTHKATLNHFSLIVNLDFNTWYKFRIFPYRKHNGVHDAGLPSEASGPAKTECRAPGNLSLIPSYQSEPCVLYSIVVDFEVEVGCDSIISVEGSCRSNEVTFQEIPDESNSRITFELTPPAEMVSYDISVKVTNNENLTNEASITYTPPSVLPCEETSVSTVTESSVETTSLVIDGNTTLSTVAPPGSSQGLYIGLGISAPVAVIVIIIIIVILIVRSKRKSSEGTLNDTNERQLHDIGLQPEVNSNCQSTRRPLHPVPPQIYRNRRTDLSPYENTQVEESGSPIYAKPNKAMSKDTECRTTDSNTSAKKQAGSVDSRNYQGLIKSQGSAGSSRNATSGAGADTQASHSPYDIPHKTAPLKPTRSKANPQPLTNNQGASTSEASQSTPSTQKPTAPVAGKPSVESGISQAPDESTYMNVTRMRTEDLATYIENKENEEDGFKHEYEAKTKHDPGGNIVLQKLMTGLKHSHSEAIKDENKKKNRFTNIIPYDHTRVKLDPIEGNPHSHYINASFIKKFQEDKVPYIAVQGPKPLTLNDMWRMVWQYKANMIVMITNIHEMGRKKCEIYWPEEVGSWQDFGPVKVQTEAIDEFADYTIRVFLISGGKGESRVVRQFHFTSWPDRCVPENAFPLLEFRSKIKAYDKTSTSPLIIHCSAGVGRTGTFIAIDYLIDQAEKEGYLDIFKCVQLLRTQRPNMIQTDDQYRFLHYALLEYFTIKHEEIPCSSFKEKFELLLKKDPQTGRTGLARQFEELYRNPENNTDEERVEYGAMTENRPRNRFSAIIPNDRFRPLLSTKSDNSSDYINAVLAHSCTKKNAFIITQMPLPNTVNELWRLVVEFDCRTIVMLNALDKTDPSCASYWPVEDEPKQRYGSIEVEIKNIHINGNATIVYRDFRVYSADPTSDFREERTVRQFQILSWKKDESLTGDMNSLLDLRELMIRWKQQSQDSPVLLHCMNGVTRCGVFYAASYALEKIDLEQTVDISIAVRQGRRARPQIIENLEQYRYLYELVEAYLLRLDTYANVG